MFLKYGVTEFRFRRIRAKLLYQIGIGLNPDWCTIISGQSIIRTLTLA